MRKLLTPRDLLYDLWIKGNIANRKVSFSDEICVNNNKKKAGQEIITWSTVCFARVCSCFGINQVMADFIWNNMANSTLKSNISVERLQEG